MENTQEKNEFPFNEFKTLFATFIKNNFRGYYYLSDGILECESEKELVKELKWQASDINEMLGGDENQSTIDDLEDEIESLKDDIRTLEIENSELSDLSIMGEKDSLHSEMKINVLNQYFDMYTPWELEELLKNGKK